MMARRGWQRWVASTGVGREVVKRNVHRLAGFERLDVLDEERRFQGVRMVVVERGALLQPEVVPIAVVTVVLQHDYVLGAQAVHDAADDRRLP